MQARGYEWRKIGGGGGMTDLIARIESADGPDRELFEDVRRAIGTHEYDAYSWRLFLRDTQWPAFMDARAWLSAAEMLVPEGWSYVIRPGYVELRHPRHPANDVTSRTSDTALALAAAALKARGV